MSALKKLNITDFKCAYCNEILVFDTADPKTYDSKSDPENFFEMKLGRYVVKHTFENEEHFNVVIVDQNHKYRGHKDYYKKERNGATTYHIAGSPLSQHSKIEFLILIDFFHKQVLELVNVTKINTINFVPKLDEFYKQNQELYTKLPEEIPFEIINKKFTLLKRTEGIFVLVSTFDTTSSDVIKTIIKKFTDVEVSPHSISLEILTLILKIVDFSDLKVTGDKILEFADWMFKNSILYVPLAIDKDALVDIPGILSRAPSSLLCRTKEQFLDIFTGKTTVLQYIQNNVADYDCVKQIIDIIERRKIITQA